MHNMLDRVSKYRERVKPIYSGTMDILVCEQNDKSLKVTPFHVRIGDLKKIHAKISMQLDEYRIEGGHLVQQKTSFSTIVLSINGKILKPEMHLNHTDGMCYFMVKQGDEISLSKTPNQSEVEGFDLNYGANIILYFLQSDLNTAIVRARIFKLSQRVRLVISDIDGTITKSDLMGNFMSMLGRNYSHEDICELYYQFHERGYFVLYVSSRSLLQYNHTRTYLERQIQAGHKLPDGPILLSDESIFEAFKSEVIYKTSDILKTKILKKVRSLFENPDCLYAGIGNRENDVIAYRVVDIPFSRIFLINKHSVIYQMDQPHPISYKHIMQNIDLLFPSLK